jgi:hypothetical protein
MTFYKRASGIFITRHKHVLFLVFHIGLRIFTIPEKKQGLPEGKPCSFIKTKARLSDQRHIAF